MQVDTDEWALDCLPYQLHVDLDVSITNYYVKMIASDRPTR
jgi:hypothetical protein